MEENVLKLARRPDVALFSAPLRRQLEKGVTGNAERPTEAIDSVEQIICTHLVSSVRDWAGRVAKRAGEGFARRVFGDD